MADDKAAIEKNRQELYSFLKSSLKWSDEQLANSTKSHPPSHTVEEWLPHGTKLFPSVSEL